MSNGITAKKGSFRGVEFDYDSGSLRGGRRGTTHEYPFRETHYDEDLGQVAPGFSVSGYVSGGDVRSKLLDLERAFNTPGHGVYYDAFLNKEFLVRCDSFSIDMSRINTNSGSFSASFVERGAEPAPSAIRNAIASLESALRSFNEALATGYNLISGTIGDAIDVAAGFRNATSYFSFAHRRNFATSDAVISSSSALSSANGFSGGIDAIGVALDDILNAQDERQNIPFLQFIMDGSAEDSAAAVAHVAFSGVALSRWAEIIISRDYRSRQEAAREIEAFVAAVNGFRARVGAFGLSDLSNEALCLSSMAGGRVSDELGDTPFLSTLDGAGKPAIVLAYEIFGDINTADDFMDSNGIVNASSVSGEVTYVVSNIA